MHHHTPLRIPVPTRPLLALGAMLVAAAAVAAPATSDARMRYEQERAACMSGQTQQDRATCLREAGAAYAQAGKRGADASSAEQQRNASKRCEPLPDAERRDCVARMQGQGTTSGSVAGGGISRELVTRSVDQVPMAPTPEGPASGPTR